MASVGAYQAKTHFAELLERVEKGERITITRHGVAIAELIPNRSVTDEDRAAAFARLETFRKGRKLGRLKIRTLIDEGRKW